MVINMRISKSPEVRRQEMMETAIKVFARKGYEATTMTDIAKEMNVVSGLCYRYFKSKEELYHASLEMYAEECSAPMIAIFEENHDSIESYIMKCMEIFRVRDGKERFHELFHQKGNEIFHKQLQQKMIELYVPYITKLLQRMQGKIAVPLDECEVTATFLIHGMMPIINDENLSPERKAEVLGKFLRKLL